MRKSIMFFAVFICAMLIMISFSKANAEKVLVIIWDGTDLIKIVELFHNGELPNAESVGQLYQLTCNMACFKTCEYESCCTKTATKSQHAIMLTGFLPDVHGVFSNGYYQVIPDGLTVYEKIENLDKAIKTAHISGKPEHFGEATFGNIIGDVDHFTAENIFPYTAAKIAMDLIGQWWNEDFFIVCHFKKPDTTGHNFGIDSEEYKEAIRTCDKHLGRILQKLDNEGILEQTKIYVLSDHGFGVKRPDKHGYAPATFIISNDTNIKDEIYMDEVARFLLSNFGLQP